MPKTKSKKDVEAEHTLEEELTQNKKQYYEEWDSYIVSQTTPWEPLCGELSL